MSLPKLFGPARNHNLRNLLLGTVAAGVVMMGYGRTAYAACTTDGTTITCTGDLSAVTPAAANPTTVLNVNSLTSDIAPASGTDGINFTSTGAVNIVSDTGTFAISTTGANADGIYGRSTVAGSAVSITHTGDIISELAQGIYGRVTNGDITISNAGNIQSDGDAISANSDSSGSVTIIHTGNLTSTNGEGIFANGGSDITVMSTGNIQASNQGISVFNFSVGAGAVNVTHTGDITSTGSQGIYAYSVSGTVTSVSTGNIQSNNRGIHAQIVADGAISVTHTGDITSTGDRGIWARSTINGAVTIVTTGTITSTNHDGIYARSGGASAVSVTHTGDITANVRGVYASSNGSVEISLGNGVVQGTTDAIEANSASGTTLNLNTGSVLIGNITIAGTAVLNTGSGLSVAHTFTGTVPTIGDVSGNIAAVSGNQIAVADISNLGAADNLLSDTLDSVFGALEASKDRYSGNWWLSGFGGTGTSPAHNNTPQSAHGFGGVVAGTHAMLGDGMQLGVFGGVSKSAHIGKLANGSNGARTDTASFFGGVYGGIATEVLLLDFALSAGGANNKGTRSVANNTVATGLETALSDYNSFFIAPEFTLSSQPIDLQGVGFTPSLRIRYELLQSAGFTETGLTSGALTMGAATSHALNVRVQGAFQILDNKSTTLTARGGVDVRYAKSSGRDATLLGVTTTAAGSGEEFSGGGFAGLDFSHALSDLMTLTGNTELKSGTNGLGGSASLGIKGKL